MNSFEYIDDYFKGTTLPEHQIIFEERFSKDHEFAEEVAFYMNTIKAARSLNEADRKKRFRQIYYEKQSSLPLTPVRRITPFVYIIAAAAVLTTLFFGLYLYTQPADPAKLADAYISKNLQVMGVQMSAKSDLMQMGKDLFNNRNYSGSLQKFEQAFQKDSANSEAIEFAGIVALQMKDFDKALRYFKQLADNVDVTVNPGKFYQALSLMKRNHNGDQQRAKILLEEVIRENIFGNEDAREFLKRM